MAYAVHEVWQLDAQEGHRLPNGLRVTVCNVRDVRSGALIASRAFAVGHGPRGRKLHAEDYRTVLRLAMTEWGTMPDVVQTDNEFTLGGHAADPLPSLVTLWLRGLGIVHRFSRPYCPTDQAHVERSHRTLNGLAGLADEQASLAAFQTALDAERRLYNAPFASRASDCAGRPPLVAHPELRRPRRPYRPEAEWVLFELARVAAFLAQVTLERKVSTVGQVDIGRQVYSLGRAWAGHTATIGCHASTRCWVFLDEQGEIMAERPIRAFDVASLTGLDPTRPHPCAPIQLALPFLVAA